MAPRRIELFIDNEYVPAASGDWFEDVDPTTGEVVAEVAEAGAEDVDRAVQAAQRRHGGPVGVDVGDQRCELLGAGGPARRRARRGVLARRDRGHGQAGRAGTRHRHPARGGQLPNLRRPLALAHLQLDPPGHPRRAGRAQLRGARAGGHRRGDLPLEPAAAADDLEGRPGAGGGQRGGGQALGGDAGDGGAFGGRDARGGHARPGSTTSSTGSARGQPARRSWSTRASRR